MYRLNLTLGVITEYMRESCDEKDRRSKELLSKHGQGRIPEYHENIS